MTTGAAATSRCVRKYTAAATRSNITPTKNTRRPSRSRSRRARTTETREALRARDTTYIERDLQDARAELSARTDEMHDPNKGMADIVKFFAAIKPYDGGKETK